MSQNIKIDPYGFREYDARWLYEKDINQSGIENLGRGLGTQIKIHTKKDNPGIIFFGMYFYLCSKPSSKILYSRLVYIFLIQPSGIIFSKTIGIYFYILAHWLFTYCLLC